MLFRNENPRQAGIFKISYAPSLKTHWNTALNLQQNLQPELLHTLLEALGIAPRIPTQVMPYIDGLKKFLVIIVKMISIHIEYLRIP